MKDDSVQIPAGQNQIEADTAPTCCSTDKQATCCERSEKSTCCGSEATAHGGCGCQ